MRHTHFHYWNIRLTDDGAGGQVIEAVCECGATLSEDMVTACVREYFQVWPPDINDPKVNKNYLELDAEELKRMESNGQ